MPYYEFDIVCTNERITVKFCEENEIKAWALAMHEAAEYMRPGKHGDLISVTRKIGAVYTTNEQEE